MGKRLSRWALITGATGGIGKAFALLCAADGYNVVLAARDQRGLRTLARDLEQRYTCKTITFAGDLGDARSRDRLFQLTKQRKCSVEVLINNAGFGDYGSFLQTDRDVQQTMIALNVGALTELAHLFGAEMVKQGEGRVLNVASTAAFLPGPYMAVYYATKAYVLSFSQALSQEWLGNGVTVTALCPGPTKTGFAQASHASKSPLFRGKLASPEDVAQYGFNAMKRGKVVAVHGLRNRVVTQLLRVIPRSVQVRLVARAQRPTG